VPDALLERLEGVVVAERLKFDARVIVGADAVRGIGVGYHFETDPQVFRRVDQDLEGAWPEEGGEPGVVMGKGMASLLRLELGDRVTLQTRTAPGAQNAMSWPLLGIVHAHNPAVDNFAVFLPYEQAQELVRAEGPSQLALRLSSREDSDSFAAGLQDGLPEGWSAEAYTAQAEDLLQINKLREKALRLIIAVILAIAATGIANTVIMSVYERIREVGTLAAMGMKPAVIRKLFLIEGAVMGFLASLVGAGVGAKINHHFSTVGFDVGNLPESSSQVAFSTTIYTSFSWGMVLLAVAFGVTVALLASLWPARFAAGLEPATAVRDDG
jgi:putative ABC transport system permease protein